MELFFEILTAALAVFGLWCLMRLIAEATLASRCITVAVDLTQAEDECADALLWQAARMLSGRRGQAVLLVCRRQWAQANDAKTLALRHGARLLVIDEQKESQRNE